MATYKFIRYPLNTLKVSRADGGIFFCSRITVVLIALTTMGKYNARGWNIHKLALIIMPFAFIGQTPCYKAIFFLGNKILLLLLTEKYDFNTYKGNFLEKIGLSM